MGKLGIAVIGIGACLACGCATATTMGGTLTPLRPPASTSGAGVAHDADRPLPRGFAALQEPLLRIGVPKSWIRVGVNATPAVLRGLEAKFPGAKHRLASNATGKQPGRMFAIDPDSDSELLALVVPTPGVSADRSGLDRIYTHDLEPTFARDHVVVRNHRLTTLGSRSALTLTADYLRGGVTVPETLVLTIAHQKLFDLTFSAPAATIKQIESTITIG